MENFLLRLVSGQRPQAMRAWLVCNRWAIGFGSVSLLRKKWNLTHMAGCARGQCVHGAAVVDAPLGTARFRSIVLALTAPKPFPRGWRSAQRIKISIIASGNDTIIHRWIAEGETDEERRDVTVKKAPG